MQKLKSQTFCHLSESVLKILTQNRVVTILDFLQEDVSKLAALTKLNLPEVLVIRNEILNKYSAPLINGTNLLEKVSRSKRKISTGIERYVELFADKTVIKLYTCTRDYLLVFGGPKVVLAILDVAINGGISVGYITEICGLAESGKTQLSLQLAINCVKDAERTVLYVDTKGDFSAVRVQKILDALGYSHKEMAVIMYKIKVVYVWTMDELVDLLRNIKNKSLVVENLALIVVDSLPCLMLQYLGDENKIGLSLLNTLVNYSRFIANEFNIGIIYINIQTRWIDAENCDEADDGESTLATKEQTYIEKRNRCLGRYWEQIPVLVLQLEKLEEHSKGSNHFVQIKVSVFNSSDMNSVNNECIVKLS